jgi:hypothetical protein
LQENNFDHVRMPVEETLALIAAARRVEVLEGSEVANEDLRELMTLLGLSLHARPISPHEVFQTEILPAITSLRERLAYFDQWATFLERGRSDAMLSAEIVASGLRNGRRSMPTTQDNEHAAEVASLREEVARLRSQLEQASEAATIYDQQSRDEAKAKRAARAEADRLRKALRDPERIARLFHMHYEALAPDHDYEIRDDVGARPFDALPENNRALMIATASAVAADLLAASPDDGPEGTGEALANDAEYDSEHGDGPQCPVVGSNYAGKPERCLRREGHPGEHMGMGSD